MRAPEPSSATQRILVAEDLEDARTTLQQLLHLSLNLEVDTAEDGQKALQMLEQRPYSILVTDLRMPKLSGLKLMEAIRILIEEIDVPVVVDAGLGAPSHAAAAMELGADAVLVNTAIAHSSDPAAMARGFRLAVEAGRAAYLAGLMPESVEASPSSPVGGLISG